MQAKVLEVVAGVDDERKLVGGQQFGEAKRQLRPADAAAEGEHGHRNRSSSSGLTMAFAL